MKRRNKQYPVSLFKLVVFFPLQFPIGIVDQNENPWPSAQVSVMNQDLNPESHYQIDAYTIPSSMKSSFLRSFIKNLQRYRSKKTTVAVRPSSSVAGRATWCLRWFEKSISRPPLPGNVSEQVSLPFWKRTGRIAT